MWQPEFKEWIPLKMCGELLGKLKEGEGPPAHMVMPENKSGQVCSFVEVCEQVAKLKKSHIHGPIGQRRGKKIG